MRCKCTYDADLCASTGYTLEMIPRSVLHLSEPIWLQLISSINYVSNYDID